MSYASSKNGLRELLGGSISWRMRRSSCRSSMTVESIIFPLVMRELLRAVFPKVRT
ncbi:hypothetical protein IR116_08955 [Streptococcus sp. 19428wA2_WM07]|nr:hypothetical protein [Streptococcus sp. 19428wA2_WM07]